MILQALYQLAQSEGLMDDPGFEMKEVPWILTVDTKGNLLGPPQATRDSKPKARAKRYRIPRQPRRSGKKPEPHFLVDNALYVLGLAPPGKKFSATDAKKRARWFREKVADCATNTQDEGVKAVLAFLEDVAAGKQSPGIPADCKAGDLFAFVYAPDIGTLVTERPAVRAYWQAERKQGAISPGDKTRCLVTGHPCKPVSKHPPLKNVPGGQGDACLVGFNQRAFWSCGWKEHENAPVSREAAEAYTTALNRLLDPTPHKTDGTSLSARHLRLSSDTVVCYWGMEPQVQDFLDSVSGLLYANPNQVKELYRSIWRGKPVELDPEARFYTVTLSRTAKVRITIRDWFESTVDEIARHLTRHFADLDIVRNTPKPKDHDLPPVLPLRVLLRSLAPQGKDDAVPAPMAADFIAAALRGTPYPLAILQRAIERMRAEIGRDDWADLERRDARAALIKAVLNRRKRFHPETTSHYREVKHDMDATNNSPGYVLGRLMAILERLQQEAMGDPNASVIDRFFSGASACPKAVFVRLLKNARHHVRKAQNDPKRGGLVFLLDRLIDDHADRFDPGCNGFPASLSLDDQGLFVLGYHQMRKWLWMNQDQRVAWEVANPDAAPAYRWSKTA